MAAIDRGFGTVPLFRMEYHQPNSFLQRTNATGTVDSPFLNTTSSQPNQMNSIHSSSGLSTNVSCFNMHSPFLAQPVTGGGSGMDVFLGNTSTMPKTQATTCSWSSTRMRRKHKQDHNDFDQSKRRKLCETPVLEVCPAATTYTGNAALPCWSPSQPQIMPAAPSLCIQSSEMPSVLTEDMEDTITESLSAAALRRLRDIESRLTIEEDEEERKNDHLPTLVMSDVLVESLKKGLDESLTKKIVDSMNRPSMELVLWKPQPQHLIDKLQSFTSSHGDETEPPQQDTPKTPFLRQVDQLLTDETQTLDCDIDPMWAREEEEMEL